MKNKNNKNKKSEEVVNHPIRTIDELLKSGNEIEKKSKENGVKQRVINILKTNTSNNIAMTTKMIRKSLNYEVREQHVNTILNNLRKDKLTKRFEESVVCDDGVRRDLIYNIWIGK